MSRSLTIKCHCKSFAATVELQSAPTRLVCYCEDCQSYARYLDQAGRVLDDNGGTDSIQISPAWFHITRGQNQLAIIRLSPSGIYRWYAQCCNTPIGNTPANPAMPYLGLQSATIKKSDIDRKLGPVKFGVGAGNQHPINAPWPVSKGFGFRGLFGTLKNIGRWRMNGDHKRSELIDADTSEPLCTPYVLSLEERRNASTSVNE